jgi:hypothetical protein
MKTSVFYWANNNFDGLPYTHNEIVDDEPIKVLAEIKRIRPDLYVMMYPINESSGTTVVAVDNRPFTQR